MKNSNTKWKVIEILKTTTDFFHAKNIENPRLNAEQLLAKVLKLSRVQLYLHFDKILTPNEITEYRDQIRRRAKHEPLQYILGKTEFMGLEFTVSPAVLIPRPETESLVEQIIDLVQSTDMKIPSIIDIGTGSGCIAVSLSHFLKESKITATDVSIDALEIAKLNAKKNNILNIDFIEHNILKTKSFPLKTVDIIVTNPPYISNDEMKSLPEEIKNFEPQIALTDFNSGLSFFEKILSLIGKDLECKFVFMEINANLENSILHITNQYNFRQVKIIDDLNNLPRVLKIEI